MEPYAEKMQTSKSRRVIGRNPSDVRELSGSDVCRILVSRIYIYIYNIQVYKISEFFNKLKFFCKLKEFKISNV
jgi:hypothetical protein